MPERFGVQTLTIATSAKVSNAAQIPNAALIALALPVMTSGELYLLGAPENITASFRRIYLQDGAVASLYAFTALPTGSCCLQVNDILRPFSYFKVEAQNPQEATRTIEVMFKLA